MSIKKPKNIRLGGRLTIRINGTEAVISESFILQTDLTFSSMAVAEQEVALEAYEAAINKGADVEFFLDLRPQSIKSKQKKDNPLNAILAEINKPDPVDLIEASVRDDQAKTKSIETSLDILGMNEIPKEFTRKS